MEEFLRVAFSWRTALPGYSIGGLAAGKPALCNLCFLLGVSPRFIQLAVGVGGTAYHNSVPALFAFYSLLKPRPPYPGGPAIFSSDFDYP